MSNRAKVIVLALFAGIVCFGGTYAAVYNREASRAAAERNALQWLRAEFKLDDAAFASIDRLHEAYSKACSEHCGRILAAKDRKAPPAEIDALAAECVASMTVHFHRVAALMPAGQGQRYLDLVLPKISAYDHRQAPSLRAN